ncbi:hypothetical protein [Flavobacterium suncheonense]|uniref:Phosphatidic acid phosphatase type 2/haloperoxidase domain-containing protein n=1 Tax=Flavobacterium suncheonense GH29-5 = DSM 17707 TaxID=1121899 RepID=A0A0A2MDT2_9FLAO|nr:hypothetical protein [Flavobacterium suncheonense]KGO90444.1 hypothetical protein Q764_02515 [Flavobacterium suncheonense GH29-5 = DSM 17707]
MDFNKALPVFSYIFHPLLVSIYGALFYFFVTKGFFYPHEIYLTLIQIAILTIFLPISTYFLLKSLGLAKSGIMLHETRERRLPLAFQSMFFLVLTQHSFSTVAVPELYYFYTGALISSVLALLLSVFHSKASLHMIGICGLTVFITGISLHYGLPFFGLIAFLIVMTGCVASSRLYMEAHSLKEILIGTFIGVLPQIGLWYYWL